MYTALVILDVVLALSLIALVMLQQGKGADAGAAFGSGSSGTVFGAAGGASMLQKITTWLAVGFFAVTLGLSMMAKDRVEEATQRVQQPTSVMQELKQEQPAAEQKSAIPTPEAIPEIEFNPTGIDAIPQDENDAPTAPEIPVAEDSAVEVENSPANQIPAE